MWPKVRVGGYRQRRQRRAKAVRQVEPQSCNVAASELEVASYPELMSKYGGTAGRRHMLSGVSRLLELYERSGKDVREVMIYGSFVSEKRTPRDIDVIFHAHEYFDLTPEQRSEENEIARAHKIDLIYATPPEKFYCDYIAFATKHGKAVRIPVSGRKHRARV